MRERKRLGRPPAAPGTARSHRLVTFVTEEEFREIRNIADAKGLSVSTACYRLLGETLGRHRAADAEKA